MIGRILILDDELFALEASRRVLRPLTSDYELLFADNGMQALHWMAQDPVDLVVADLMMPGMKGTDFLKEVRRRFPQTARLILSGYTEREMMLGSVPLAHQTIAKPCPPDLLISILRHVLKILVGIRNPAVRAAVAHTAQLPVHPEVRRELLANSGSSGGSSTRNTPSIVARDVGLATAVLKLANSPMLQPQRPICSVDQAVRSLGTAAVCDALAAEEPLPSLAWDGLAEPHTLTGIWKHSWETAIAAQTIARIEQCGQDLLDETFAAGLLHDVGKFLLVSKFPSEYSETVRLAVEENIDISNAERQVFGLTHSELGAALLGLWGFPSPIIDTVSRHARPGENSATFSALTAVHVASALVHECDTFPNSTGNGLDPALVNALGYSKRLDAWRAAVREVLSVSPVSA